MLWIGTESFLRTWWGS